MKTDGDNLHLYPDKHIESIFIRRFLLFIVIVAILQFVMLLRFDSCHYLLLHYNSPCISMLPSDNLSCI